VFIYTRRVETYFWSARLAPRPGTGDVCASRHLLYTAVFIIIRTKHDICYVNYSILLYSMNQVNSVWSGSGDNTQGRHIFGNDGLAPRPGTGDVCALRPDLCITTTFRINRTKHIICYTNYSILLYNKNQVNSVWSGSGDNAQGRHIFWNDGLAPRPGTGDMCAS